MQVSLKQYMAELFWIILAWPICTESAEDPIITLRRHRCAPVRNSLRERRPVHHRASDDGHSIRNLQQRAGSAPLQSGQGKAASDWIANASAKSSACDRRLFNPPGGRQGRKADHGTERPKSTCRHSGSALRGQHARRLLEVWTLHRDVPSGTQTGSTCAEFNTREGRFIVSLESQRRQYPGCRETQAP